MALARACCEDIGGKGTLGMGIGLKRIRYQWNGRLSDKRITS